MKKLITIASIAVMSMTATVANASDASVYVVKFRSNDCATCAVVDNQLNSALNMVQSPAVKEVVIDSSDALKWEKSAHTAFDHNIVKQFNNWVGLTGFVAVIDANTHRTLGCVTDKTDVYKSANFIKQAAGLAHDRQISNRSSQFKCPAVYNIDPGQ